MKVGGEEKKGRQKSGQKGLLITRSAEHGGREQFNRLLKGVEADKRERVCFEVTTKDQVKSFRGKNGGRATSGVKKGKRRTFRRQGKRMTPGLGQHRDFR